MKLILRILMVLAFLTLMLFVPAIPVLSSPVIPNPTTEMVSLSLFDLVMRQVNHPLGVTIVWEWYSYLALGLLLAIMTTFSLLLVRIRL
jgi:hypothetical protein